MATPGRYLRPVTKLEAGVHERPFGFPLFSYSSGADQHRHILSNTSGSETAIYSRLRQPKVRCDLRISAPITCRMLRHLIENI